MISLLRVQVVGGRGNEVGIGGSRHLGPAKLTGLEAAMKLLGVTDLLLLMGSDMHLEAGILGLEEGVLNS